MRDPAPRQALTPDAALLLEADVARGSVFAMIELALDALDHGVEMERRKRLLLLADHSGNLFLLRLVMHLAARTGDLRMARFFVPDLEKAGEIDIGYLCWRDAPEADRARWDDFLRSSAALGYIPARRKLASVETRERSVLLFPFYWLRLAKLLEATIALAWRDPLDRRLPNLVREKIRDGNRR